MRRSLALLAVGLVLSACSSAVEGRGRTGTDAPSQTAPTPVPSTPVPSTPVTDEAGAGVLASTASTSAALSSAPPTPTAPTTAAPGSPLPATAAPTSTSPTDASSTAAPVGSTLVDGSTAAGPQLPPGFYAAGGELAYRPMSTDEFDCTPDQASGCFGIMVFSQPGCPVGAGVTVGIFDKARDPDNPIGSASGTTPPIPPGGNQGVVIADSTGVVANLTARVQQVVC